MKDIFWILTVGALILALLFTLSGPGFAQFQGGGRWGGGKGAGYGRGPGTPNCPNYPGYQNRGQNRPNYPGWNCPRGSNFQTPASPPASPPSQTPESQIGK
jgi:hypothetical protein